MSVLVSVHCTKLCLYVYRPISVWTSLDGQISPLLKTNCIYKEVCMRCTTERRLLVSVSLVFVCVSLSLYLCLCRCICVLLEPLKRSCHTQHPPVACIVPKGGNGQEMKVLESLSVCICVFACACVCVFVSLQQQPRLPPLCCMHCIEGRRRWRGDEGARETFLGVQ